MEVKSDLSGVRVGDILWSLRYGTVEVTDVSETHIYGHSQASNSFSFRITRWRTDGKFSPFDVTPDLYYPGVQIIPAGPPKRMKKVTVERWIALYRDCNGDLSSCVGHTKDCFLGWGMVGQPQLITWGIEVEDA